MRKFALATVAILGLVLCASSAARAEDIENPEYKQWAAFKAGSFVTMKLETETSGSKTEMENTTTLLEITKEKAVIETKGHMMMGGNKIDIPAQKREIAAKVKKSEDKAAETKKPKESNEEIEVGGKKLKCKVIEMDSEAAGTKTHTKVWMSDEIPGGTAKSESHSEGAMKMTAKQWADKWEKK